jgi:hypothetical protein
MRDKPPSRSARLLVSGCDVLRGAAEDVSVEGWFNDRVWPMESHLTPADVRVGARWPVRR